MVGAPRPIVATRQLAQNDAQEGQLNLIECVREPAICSDGSVTSRTQKSSVPTPFRAYCRVARLPPPEHRRWAAIP